MRLREVLTWNPLNTPEVKEIVAHATKFEILQMQVLGAAAGLLFGTTLAVFSHWVVEPVAVSSGFLETLGLLCVLIGILTLEVLAVRSLNRWQLSNTGWAREHEIDRKALKITRWP